MYEKSFALEIVTPTKVVYKGDAASVSAPGVMGGFQVLYNHAPLLAQFEVGEIKVKDASGSDIIYATSGGFVEVNSNHVVVLADTAERTSEIDVARAQAAKERALQRLHDRSAAVDEQRARAALMRASNRLHLAQKA